MSSSTSEAESPSRSPRRARKFAAKTEAVLDAAMSIVIDEGLPGLTLGKVARKLDVAVGGLYRYFASKEALVTGLQQAAIGRFGARLEADLGSEAADGPLEHALRPFWLYVRQAQSHPNDHRLMDVFLSQLDPTLEEPQALEVEGVLGPILARAQAGLHAAATAGVLDAGDDRQRTLLLWGATHGMGHLRSRERLEAPAYHVEPLCEQLFASLLRGFGATRQAAERAAAAVVRERA